MRTIPLIYESNTTALDGHSLGSLPDAIECKVTEERHGDFFLEMTYNANGLNSSLLEVGRIIAAKPNMFDDVQAFRIASMEKSLNGTILVEAYHISYDLSQVIVMPYSANSLSDALDGFTTYGTPSNTFTFTTDKTSNDPFSVTAPASLRSLLFGTEGSILDVYGGEFRFNNWNVELLASRGQDRNVQIAYGKNLSAFKETDLNGAYDAIIPFAIVEDVLYTLTDTNVCPTAPVVPTRTVYGYPKSLAVNFSDQFTDTAPTQTDLYNLAVSYIARINHLPTANLATEYVDLAKLLGNTERVDLCDRVWVSVQPFGIYNYNTKVVKTVYDCLSDTYQKVSVGDRKITLADTLAEMMR